ncbi:hypothetical protein ACIPYS_00335 [Kitasatospora sp. NPDC089913]|uniref:PD-(D/E)XK nuclease domain-containing protein n=1 Tax=Kitasatospora sp. NPDC089913 TaxID=3364080 RepID=UPI00382658FA
MTVDRRAKIEELISESHEMERDFSAWQVAGELSADDLTAGAQRYVHWYYRALDLIPDAESEQFRNMYEGGSFVKRIRAFISSPLQVNELLAAGENIPESFKWLHPYQKSFAESIGIQRSILAAAIYGRVEVAPVLDELATYFSRIPEYLRTLSLSGRDRVVAPVISDEKDLQALVHALLKLHYDDVRPEDYAAQHAGARSRVDFLIREAGVVVETKMTRDGLTDRRVGEELLIDWGRYSRHPDCRGIIALIYDPDFRISNPVGLASDLSRDQGSPATRAIVVR